VWNRGKYIERQGVTSRSGVSHAVPFGDWQSQLDH
jgi:hypothetical protein